MQNDTCYILALIKRDDGERLLLGSGFYEFSAGQKHFNPNQFANDVVELQGTDGQLLAGQVRRSTSQVFEGVIGDGTTSKQMVEQKRREFFLFFRKQHHYTVVYIMPDGTAIKRDRGYITEAPAVQELYQFQPKWRVALAFEDVNYYSYAEDDQGQEIYSFEATLALANISDGGLVWDDKGAISSKAGLNIEKINGDTFQQTYEGKNLFDIEQYSNALLRGGGTGVSLGKIDSRTLRATNKISQSNNFCGIPVPNYTELLGKTVTVSGSIARHDVPNTRIIFAWNTNGVSTFGQGLALTQDGTFSLTQSIPASAPSGAIGLLVVIYANGEGTLGGVDSYVDWSDIQLEVGSPASSYEPYVGGTPSPSPEFPQQIQTVTGVQTISINGTDYPLDLGTIELCKLGTYQDYVYKSGSDWKVHKATGSYTFDGEEPNWVRSGNTTTTIFVAAIASGFKNILDTDTSTTAREQLKSDYFIRRNVLSSGIGSIDIYNGGSAIGMSFDIQKIPDIANAKAWVAANRPTIVAVAATPTDAVITDQALIAQLEAIAEAMRTDGKPTAIVPTGQNLAAIITNELNGTGGYIFAPSTGGGPVVVTVNGVDNASPVWRVTGPATNPTLTNSTTGQSLVWNGTVPADQTLVIDMGAQTATLEGANVFEFVSGSWVQLEPGQNRISYTAGNTTKSSIVQWNEVVG